MVDLYYSWYSICSEKVLACLFEKSIPFTGHHIDLFDFAQVEPDYLKVNPDGTVPALVDGETIVRESTVINEYLDVAEAFYDQREKGFVNGLLDAIAKVARPA